MEKIPTQGGSLRIYISRDKREDNTVNQILNEEQEFKLYELKTYRQFSINILQLKSKTLELLKELKSKNKRIVGYGAPGKAANYLNYFGIGTNYLDALVDISPTKQGKYFPNTGLKIYSLEYLEKKTVDYIFILAWNYADSIIENLAYLKKKNVNFIISFPQLKIIKIGDSTKLGYI
ncbi:MAG: hypothetical protein M9887_11065 [Chitinophagales bacterium]|nr:hypothetical protein [Chitinophagales bacterium]